MVNRLEADLRYPRGGRVHHHRFELPRTQTVWISGESGIGKSSLLLAMAGLIAVDDGGYLRYDGKNLVNVPTPRRPLVLMPQGESLLAHLRLWQNVAMGHARGWRLTRTDRQRACLWLERVNLGGMAEMYPAQISGGQAQRVMLARCLHQMQATRRKLLLLDEATSALDADTRDQVCAVITEEQRAGDWTVIWVAHQSVPHDQHWLMEESKDQVILASA